MVSPSILLAFMSKPHLLLHPRHTHTSVVKRNPGWEVWGSGFRVQGLGYSKVRLGFHGELSYPLLRAAARAVDSRSEAEEDGDSCTSAVQELGIVGLYGDNGKDNGNSTVL